MIRFNTTVDTRGIDAIQSKIQNLPSLSNYAMQRAVTENESAALAELRDTPARRPVPKAEFTPKQWGFLWASGILKKDAAGNIIPYKRTGALMAAWSIYAVDTPEGGKFVFQNTSNAARYVIGTLAQNLNMATRLQQPFHKKTGWEAASPTAQFWVASIVETYKAFMGDAWSSAGTIQGRAYTSPRPKKKVTP